MTLFSVPGSFSCASPVSHIVMLAPQVTNPDIQPDILMKPKLPSDPSEQPEDENTVYMVGMAFGSSPAAFSVALADAQRQIDLPAGERVV